jgi:membrane protein DedA with SNARE-associated domain
MRNGIKNLGELILILAAALAFLLLCVAVHYWFVLLRLVGAFLGRSADFLRDNHPLVLDLIGWSICAILPLMWVVKRWRNRVRLKHLKHHH